jgi:hypothetical protein
MTDDNDEPQGKIVRGSKVRVDLSIRYEDVDKVVDARVFRVKSNEDLPYHIDWKGRVSRVSEDSIIEVIER